MDEFTRKLFQAGERGTSADPSPAVGRSAPRPAPEPRPFCPRCNRHVSPQVTRTTGVVGPSVMVDTAGPVDLMMHQTQDIPALHCSYCGTEVMFVHYCPACTTRVLARREYARASGFSWDRSAMDFCTRCGAQVAGPPRSQCFVATAAYGGADHPSVEALRQFRDRRLTCTWVGRAAIVLYYAVGPILAWLVVRLPLLARVVRALLDRFVIILRKGEVL